ncbi:MAG: Rieske (2Fe-2S) protein [Thermodesulfobacteriota bacterium]
MFVEVAKKDEIAPGGMKGYALEGMEVVLCNDGGKFYALQNRCGHMSAPLDKGTLVGYILTCPMHCAQFDITSGAALSGPVPHNPAQGQELPEGLAAFFMRIGSLMADIKTCNIKTFKVRVEGKSILVDL